MDRQYVSIMISPVIIYDNWTSPMDYMQMLQTGYDGEVHLAVL